MRILHVVRGLTNASGTTHIVGPLAEEEARLGHDVSLYFVEKGSEPPVTPDPRLVASVSFAVTALGGHPGLSLPLVRRLDAMVGRFDVVHIHAVWNFASYAAMRAAARAGVPYIVAPQGSLEPWALAAGSWRRRLYARHLETPLIGRASRLHCPSGCCDVDPEHLAELDRRRRRGFGGGLGLRIAARRRQEQTAADSQGRHGHASKPSAAARCEMPARGADCFLVDRAVIEALRNRTADLAFVHPGGYVLASREARARIVVKNVWHGKTSFTAPQFFAGSTRDTLILSTLAIDVPAFSRLSFIISSASPNCCRASPGPSGRRSGYQPPIPPTNATTPASTRLAAERTTHRRGRLMASGSCRAGDRPTTMRSGGSRARRGR